MKKPLFKLTAIASAMIAMSACNDSSKKSSAPASEETIESEVVVIPEDVVSADPVLPEPEEDLTNPLFKIESYTPVSESSDIYGTWVMTSREEEIENVLAIDTDSGNKVTYREVEETLNTNVISVYDSYLDDAISVSTSCGEGQTYYKVAENTYERGGDYEEGVYTSEFNEDGSCADGLEECEKYTLTFNDDKQAAFSSIEQEQRDGSAYIYHEYDEGSDYYYSYSELHFDTEIFSDIGIERESGIYVLFNEDETDIETGALVKISNFSDIVFNENAITYNGSEDITDEDASFNLSMSARCFSYEEEVEESITTTTKAGQEDIVRVENASDNELEIYHDTNGTILFESVTDIHESSGYAISETSIWTNIYANNSWIYLGFWDEEESIDGLSISCCDSLNITEISFVDGVLMVSGSAEGDINAQNPSRLEVNINLDVNDVTQND